MQYKAHIDGLRTLAVVPVVMFHLSPNLLTGGFVGVDVFFVISGFLITGILYEQMTDSSYSLLEFYKRRFLRILPALAVVLLFCATVSSALLLPIEQGPVGESIAAAALFYSNFYFWLDSGYFARVAASKPLLHTWSLAVEEQFYFLAPPLLFLGVRYFRKYLLALIGVLVFGSFICCVLLTLKQPETAFYLLPARAWELGLGGGLAIWAKTRPLPLPQNAIVAASGVLLIAASMVLLTERSAFPGWNASYPCIGAVLIIGWAEGNVVGRLLSSPIMVWLGKVSYGLYLWHWPLIVFWKIRFGQDLSGAEMLVLGAASLVMAAVSTFIIEHPFRTAGARRVSARKAVLYSAASVGLVAAVGLAASRQMIQLRQFPDDVLKIASVLDYEKTADYQRQFRTGSCMIAEASGGFEAFDADACATPHPTKRNILVFGDSHAAQYSGAFRDLYPEHNVMQVTASGCLPLLNAGGRKRCTRMREWVFEEMLSAGNIDVVVIAARWTQEQAHLVEPTLRRIKQSVGQVIVIGPTVEYRGDLPLLLSRSMLHRESFDFRETLTPGKAALDTLIASHAAKAGTVYLSALEAECMGETCKLLASDGLPMQFDYGHLTLIGAKDVLGVHREAIEPVLAGR